MKRFLGFVSKEFHHILRDRRTMLILFGMPVIQMILFGFAIRNEINDARITILDPSRDLMTRAVTERLLAGDYFLLASHSQTIDQARSLLESGDVKMAVVFPPEFARRYEHDGFTSIQLITDASEPNTASTLTTYATSIIRSYQATLQPGIGEIGIQPEVRLWYNPELKSVYLFVPGLIALLLMLVSALMTSITITREKELGTMEILLVSPIKPIMIIIGKVIPYLILSMINTLTILGLARWVFGVPFLGSYGLFFLEAFLFVLTALALGLLISTTSDTQQTAMMKSLAGLMLPVIILSGFIFPISSMPVPLQYLSNIVPAKWFLIIVKGIMLKGVGLEHLWKETLVLVGMATALVSISVARFKSRLG